MVKILIGFRHDGCCKKINGPPFEISVFPILLDHSLLQLQWLRTEKTLKDKFQTDLNKKIMIYGGKGIAGGISAIMCAQNGQYYNRLRWYKKCSKNEEYKSRFGVDIKPGDGSSDEMNSSFLPEADINFALRGLELKC